MYKGSKTEEKINSILIFNKLSNDNKYKIHTHLNNLTKNWIVVKPISENFKRDFLTIIFNNSSLRIHFEIDKFKDNELIVELKSYANIIQPTDQKIVEREDLNTFYIQFEFINQDQFDLFFEKIVWPYMINNDEIF